ncbi:hypothetical protein Thal_0084 [Thermocrinis albus DSM 14484]|uniref:Uncharacterized protein n=1 Tax=Thermocrinis albus (strain DSM 14484 / JCM 11386 / HI 11/12) TaxID=638303 RepID=D3SNI4_THEAH|nr:flagellar hook-length control protein FliK [Thermocrinis albus]ADC88721.1 hypothetical protein Thal_0084 [Thermocrinis albus DSM 14484]
MEIRRVEGVFLEHAIDTSQGYRAQEASSHLRIKLASTVPEVLLSALRDGSIRGRVLDVKGGVIRILLEGGYEIMANNKLSIDLRVGDLLDMMVERGTESVVLRVVKLIRFQGAPSLMEFILQPPTAWVHWRGEDLRSFLWNSGIFYEKKLVKLLLGDIKPEELMEDAKAKLILSGSKEGVKAVQAAQWVMAQHGVLVVSWEMDEEGERRGYIFLKADDQYRVMVDLRTGVGRLLVLVQAPRKDDIPWVRVTFVTPSQYLMEKLESSLEDLRSMLREEGVELRDLQVKPCSEEEIPFIMRDFLPDSGIHMVV